VNVIKNVAKNIRKYRKGVSLKKLAEKADIPVTTLEQIYYRCRNDILASTLIKIAKALQIPVDELVK